MTRHILKSAALSAALLLGTAGVTAMAIDVGVSVGSGVNASASVSSGSTGTTLNIGSGTGPLATVNSTGAPGDGSQTDATVNLGSLLAGLDLGGGAGADGADGTNGAGGGGGGFQTIVDRLSEGDRQMLALRCRAVLDDPVIYKDDVVEFCRMIVKLNM